MKDLTGYMSVNGTDLFTEYGAFLCELSATDCINMTALLKSPKMKTYTPVTYRERHGEQLPEVLPSPRYEAVDRTLQFAITANTDEARHGRYAALMERLSSGWLEMAVGGLRTYRMYLSEPQEPAWYRHWNGNDTYLCVFKAKFREPEPVPNTD